MKSGEGKFCVKKWFLKGITDTNSSSESCSRSSSNFFCMATWLVFLVLCWTLLLWMLKSLTHCCQQPFFAIAEIKIFVVSYIIFQCFSGYENASRARAILIEILIPRWPRKPSENSLNYKHYSHRNHYLLLTSENKFFCLNTCPTCAELLTMHAFVSTLAQKLQCLRSFNFVKCTVLFTYSSAIFLTFLT